MTTTPTLTSLEKARELNQAVENNYLALAEVLVEIEESKAYTALGYDNFPSYYKLELGREKSTISRLLNVGRWLKQNALALPEATSYKKLDEAIKAFPDKEPDYILAAAKENTIDELRDERTEREVGVHEHDIEGQPHYAECKVCGRYIKAK